MVTNRLDRPKAIYNIPQWAKELPIEEVYGIKSERLNDDRSADLLDSIYAYSKEIQSEIVLNATHVFGLDMNEIHFDITTFSVYGVYESNNGLSTSTPEEEESIVEQLPKIVHSFSKANRPNLKQVGFGINVTSDGAVPILSYPLNGNQEDSKSHIPNLKKLKDCFKMTNIFYIADSKLATNDNFLEIIQNGNFFLSTAPFHNTDEFLNKIIKEHSFQLLTYLPKSEKKKPIEKRKQYYGIRTEEQITEKDGKSHNISVIYVLSESLREQERKTRERHIKKIKEKLEKITKRLNKYCYKTEEGIKKHIYKTLSLYKGKYEKCFITTLSKREDKFELEIKENTELINKLEQLDGKYKKQIIVEQRIHHLKEPLAVSPIFLKKPERIVALLFIITIVYTLIERELRKALNDKPIRLSVDKRKNYNPTTYNLMSYFYRLMIVIVIMKNGKTICNIENMDEVHLRVLALLKIKKLFVKRYHRYCNRKL